MPTRKAADSATLQTPSGDGLREGACHAGEHAQQLLRAGVTLGDAGQFGVAVSILILALEEAAKAITLGAAWRRHTLKVQDADLDNHLRLVLRGRHDARYAKAIYDYFLTPAIRGSLLSIRVRATAGASLDTQAEISALVKSHPDLDKLKWIAGAKEKREAGLYVDYRDGAWRTPESVSALGYIEARDIVASYVEEIASQLRDVCSPA